jgi:hypothetical protein
MERRNFGVVHDQFRARARVFNERDAAADLTALDTTHSVPHCLCGSVGQAGAMDRPSALERQAHSAIVLCNSMADTATSWSTLLRSRSWPRAG